MAARYCADCKRKHRSDKWYGHESFYFCTNAYTRMFRAGFLVVHPYWSVLYNAVQDTDCTGCRIAAASYRHDVRAVADAYAMLGLYPQLESYRLLVCLFAAQMYFSWPMHDLINAIGQSKCSMVNRSLLRKIGHFVFRRYSSMRVHNGRLSTGIRGCSATKNPSERRNGQVRYDAMLDDLPGCIRICDAMSVYFNRRKVVSLSAMLSIFAAANSNVYDSRRCYKNIRCCRLLACSVGISFENSEADWEISSNMSSHVSSTLTTLGLKSFKYAVQIIRVLRQELEIPMYSINDLTIFVCLLNSIQHKD